MSKYTAEQVLAMERNLDVCAASVIAPELRSILREYAAHLAAQAEWPSDEDAKKAARVYAKETGVPLDGVLAPIRAALQSVCPPAVPMEGHTISVKSCDGEWEGEARWEHQEQAYVTHKAVRPPDGVVSDEDVGKAIAAFNGRGISMMTLCRSDMRSMRAALESYASRHAPTMD